LKKRTKKEREKDHRGFQEGQERDRILSFFSVRCGVAVDFLLFSKRFFLDFEEFFLGHLDSPEHKTGING